MSRKRRIFLAFMIVVAFLLQISVFPQFKIFGVQPDLILVIAVVVAIQEGPVEGATIGFFGGLLQDVASSQVMGVGAFSKAVAAFFAGILKDLFMTYTILLPVILVFLASLLELSLHQAALAVLGQEQLPPFKGTILLATAFYNVLIVFVLYPLMRRFRFPVKDESMSLTRPSGPSMRKR